MPFGKKSKLVAIQVSKAVKHDLKLDHLFILKDALVVMEVDIEDVEVWVIHPKNLHGSTVNSIIPSLKVLINHDS